MGIDAKKILQKLQDEEPPRKPVSIYMDTKVYAAFKDNCGTLSASRVMEALIVEFIASIQTKDSRSEHFKDFLDKNMEKLESMPAEELDTLESAIECYSSVKETEKKKKATS